MPFWFLPKDVGLKGAFMRCGLIVRLQGTDVLDRYWRGSIRPGVSLTRSPISPGTCLRWQYDSGNVVRTSVGVGLNLGVAVRSLRFERRVPLTKGQFDRVPSNSSWRGTSF